MGLQDEYKIELLQMEIEKIQESNTRYQEIEQEKQEVISSMLQSQGKGMQDLIERLCDLMEIQNFLVIKTILKIGIL